MGDKLMRTVKRYLRIYLTFLRFDFIYSMTYRTSFLIELGVEMFYTVTSIVFFNVLYGNIKSIGGWTYEGMILLVGIETVYVEFLVGAVFAYNTNMLPERIRMGEVDYALLRPLNAMFMLTFAQPYVPSFISMLPGFYLIHVALTKMHLTVAPIALVSGSFVFLCGCIIGYSIMVMVSSLAFRFVGMDTLPRIGMNTTVSFSSRPHQMYKGLVMKGIFFILVPVVFTASIPATIFMKGFDAGYVVLAASLAAVFFFLAHTVWHKMIGEYSSASS